jgi:uncharacterized protein
VKIVWDEPKRLANLEKHGLGFAELDEAFFENALVAPGNKPKRWRAIGVNAGGVLWLCSPASAAKVSAL